MKVILSLLIGLSLTPGVRPPRASQEHELPTTIRLKLDEKFPGWRFAPISDEIRQATKEYLSPDSQLDLIKGDFDGNGESDYALLIEHGDRFDGDGNFAGRNVFIVAFLKKGDEYKFYPVDSEAGDYLMLRKKGEGSYDFDTQRQFTFANDAIDSVIFEKAATSYVYENGKFRAIITGD